MDLGRLTDDLAGDLRRSAAVGGEATERAAEALIAGLEPAVRLRLLEALHEAAAELEGTCPGATVTVRLEGRRAVLGLVAAPAEPAGVAEPAGNWSEDELLRLTIRLPEGLKTRVEQAAALTGASINSWVVAALARALDGAPGPGFQPGRRVPRRITGFVQG